MQASADSSGPSFDVEVFYDGDCPLCMREIRMLMKLDKKKRIAFTNIAEPSFEPSSVGLTRERLMDRIHARLPSGEIIEGVEVFRRLYTAIGLGSVVALTRLPGVSHGLDVAYRVFAKNRLKWTGRCDENGCVIPSRAPSADAATDSPVGSEKSA